MAPGMATGGNCTTSNGTTWSLWVDGTATTSGASTGEVWSIWASDTASGATNNITQERYSPPPETEEQRQTRLEREQHRKEEREAKQRERQVAQRKAEELLRENLDKEQREQFDKTKWFYVISQSGKQYRIRHGWIGNIDEINEDDLIAATHCIHPAIRVPIEDSMLIQKLMLEADESRLLEIANRAAVRVPYPVLV